ncbi:hypothetical protein ZWY2020_045599 [Hordeum vulgare]|nr:hypothetical protein ZWY2020_045599 [Hordeum vulgare]
MEKRKRVEKEEKNPPTTEILSEILSRVPYRSLCRFKCDVGGEGLLSFLNLFGWGLVRMCGYVEVMPMHCCGGILLCYCNCDCEKVGWPWP